MLAPVSTSVLKLDYFDDLWWLLHSSDKGNELVLGLTSYLDDSGSDENSPIAVIGGPVFSRIHFKNFCVRWREMLDEHHIPEPPHMTDFVQPHGKHSGMLRELKIALFNDVVRVIHGDYQFSVSVAIPQVDFKTVIPDEEVRKCVAGPSALAFFSTVLINREMAIKHGLYKIAYLVDCGSRFYSEQLIDAHAAVVKAEMSKDDKPTGGLNFDTDDNVPALQAADVIAWSARRNEVGKLIEEFEPLSKLIQSKSHIHKTLPIDGVAMLATPLYAWIVKHGSMPSWKDIIRP